MLQGPVAARADAQAASPFPVVPMEPETQPSHRWAYAALGGGAALVGSSFLISHQADRAYARYLVETDPGRIDALYDETVRDDWLARGALIGGEALIATGLYLRFLRHGQPSRVSLAIDSRRCALAWRF